MEKDGSILLPSQKSKAHSASGYTQAPLRTPEWSAFFNANGKWTVLVDKATLTPHRAFGKPVQIKNFDNVTIDNVESASMQFLRDYSNLLNINPDNLKLINTKKVNKLWYVGYKQVYKGIEVLLSKVEMKIREDGKVIAFGVDYYNNMNVNITPTISFIDAAEKSFKGLENKSKIDKVQSERKVLILPVKFNGKVNYHLVYDVKIETSNPIGKYTSFVDAHSGNIIWRLNNVQNEVTIVNVKGLVKNKYSYDTTKLIPFPNQYFNVGPDRDLTDRNGTWSTNDISAQKTITAKMEGPWAKVQYLSGTYQNPIYEDSASFSGSIMPGNNFALNWNDNNSHLIERMLFYHANYIHDYLKNLDPDFDGLDLQAMIYITQSQSPNAGALGENIIFYEPYSPEYKFAETPSILYHEYTHNVNHKIYDQINHTTDIGMINLTCNEATADLGSAFMIDDEMIGRGAFGENRNKNIRTLENENIYPDSIDGESHHDGMILSGAFWDFRKTTSRAVAEEVSHYCKYGTPDDPDAGIAFSEWFLEALQTDDNLGTGDNDLSNGTPHLSELVAAFNEHQIGTDLLLTMSYEHTALPDTKNIVDPYIVEFNLKSEPNILNSHPDSVFVVYSTDNLKNINMVPAVKVHPDSNIYRAEIPAMQNGTIVKYYIQATESVSGRTFKFTAVFPDFKPYQFLVGYETLYLEDFEEEPSWSRDEDDNATNGLWEWAVPKEESLYSPDGNMVLQPGEDHSIIGTKCFVTGSLVSVSGPIVNFPGDYVEAMQQMPDGTTTLISRIYDLSKVEKPLVRYYKYFTSEFWFYYLPGYESTLIFSVSSNGGSSWTDVDTLTASTWDWTKSLVYLEDYLQLTGRMRFKFTVTSMEIQQGLVACLTEALVDDFEILYPSSNVAPPSVVADFAGKPTTGVSPLSVQFSDSSKGAISSWWWDFGDGSANSSEKNPVHLYNSKGSYNVSLTVSDGDNTDTKTRNNYINVSTFIPEFRATPIDGLKPLNVQFTDMTQGTVSSWFWDFGDGETSTLQNPTHTFTDEGSYSVILQVKNLNDSSEAIKDDYISVYDVFGASFTTDKTFGVIPLTIKFSDQSFGNPTSWSWDFGDGTTSTLQNPSHVYTVQGIYNVSLTVSDGSKQSTKTRTDLISAYHNLAVNDDGGLTGLSIYPNPFSSSTSIYYELLNPAHVTLKIYDLMGNLVSSLVDESQADGRRIAVWNGTKHDGTKANTGLYFYRLQAGSKTYTGKLILY